MSLTSLLRKHEPQAVAVERHDASSPFFITCDHASNKIPESLGTLGLEDAELKRHIAWDIGAAEVSKSLSRQLNATLVMQNYSRLVIDCNRPHDHEHLIPAFSEATNIPGNRDVTERARASRIDEIFTPYHDAITDLMDQRQGRAESTVFVAIHSFTPNYHGRQRPWDIGILYRDDCRLADPMLAELNTDKSICVGDNEPYQIDHKDYGIPVHAEARGIAHVLIEIRQDLISSPAGQQAWAKRLGELLARASLNS